MRNTTKLKIKKQIVKLYNYHSAVRSRIKLFLELWRNMGSKYIMFRLQHTLAVKLGLLVYRFPTQLPDLKRLSKKEWRDQCGTFFFSPKDMKVPIIQSDLLREEVQRIFAGELHFFSATWVPLGNNYDWITHPESGFRHNVKQHWSKINDFSKEAGDIKYIWEKSRFSYLYTIIRYDYHFGEDHSEWVWSEMESWINANPYNCGPNYMCSQEISIRVLNWIFALVFYAERDSLTDERINLFLRVINGQMQHVYSNINFSRIAVRNNHALTETLALYLVGLLFPFLPESIKWKNRGKAWFEEEIIYQIYDDGTFLQFSHNYHRVVVQLLTWAIHLAHANGDQFKEAVYDRAKSSVDYLYQCQILENGKLPNYGANDGALFFKLTSADYRDYRPQLNALYHALSGKILYPALECGEDHHWYSGYEQVQIKRDWQPVQKAWAAFSAGGIYTIRDAGTLTFMKCITYKDRPSQADNLHLDIWINGENVLPDAGSYKYNTEPELVRYFWGTQGHNTISINGLDQMEKGSRFIWLHWNKNAAVEFSETADAFQFNGSVEAFGHFGSNIIISRTVKKRKGQLHWEVLDSFNQENMGKQKPAVKLMQYWHPMPENTLNISATDEIGRPLIGAVSEGWYSGYYGIKNTVNYLVFETGEHTIKTIIKA